ncbi:MAG: outer membrane beta-barrel protein [Bacteroidales bacterium]|nr:outer membrane beta-barrel protein [Bacteroidales bacterium]
MKQFDETLRQQAEKAFSGYNADHLADAGWNSFVSKQKRKGLFAIVIPLWAKAASVALLILGGSYIAYKATIGTDSPANIAAEEMRQEQVSPEIIPAITGEETTAIISDANASRRSDVTGDRIGKVAGEPVVEILEFDASPIIAVAAQPAITTDSANVYVHPAGRDTASDSLANKVFEEALKELKSIDEPVTEPVVADAGRGATLMAGLSGMMSRVDNAISSSPGVSMGLYVDKRISERISFRPGVAIAMHSIDVNGSDGSQNFDYVMPAYSGWTGEVDSYEANLNMIVVEIPLNFVLSIRKRERSEFFITAGASTMIYMAQHFEASFLNEYSREELDVATGSLNTIKNYSLAEVENDYVPLSHADYLGLANISAGYLMPFGKKNSMLIEPFLQLPLSELTSRNVKIRYGGVSMKLTFGKK